MKACSVLLPALQCVGYHGHHSLRFEPTLSQCNAPRLLVFLGAMSTSGVRGGIDLKQHPLLRPFFEPVKLIDASR